MTKGVIVSFRYPGTKELVLDHVGLKIEPSENRSGREEWKGNDARKASLQAVCEPEEGEIL